MIGSATQGEEVRRVSTVVDKNDVRKLLEDPGLVEEIAKGVMEDPVTLDGLAKEIADELSDMLKDAPEFRANIIQSAMGNKAFKDRLLRKLAKKLGDQKLPRPARSERS